MPKVTKLLLWLVVVGIGIYTLALLAIPFLVEPEVIEPRKLPERDLQHLTDAVGWYEVEPGLCVLLTFAADGELALVGLEKELFFHRFELIEADRYLWRPGNEEPGIDVQLVRSDEGEVVAFDWKDEDDEPRQASLCDGPYEPRDASYSHGDIHLAGTLFVPEGTGPHPAAVMIHGSGDSDRDNLWYLQIAHHLASHEIAVLLPDKRGSGLSSGEWRLAGFEDFVADTDAGLDFVRSQTDIDPARVGLIGVSQGGSWIAPMTAADDPALAFVVSLSGAAVAPNRQLAHESVQTLVQMGFPKPLAIALQPIASAVPKARRPEWWQKNGGVDPMPYWEKVEVPVLVLYGREDERDNVPVRRSVARLTPLLERRGADFRVEVFDGVGHGFREPESRHIRPDILEQIGIWATRHTELQ